jgi:predicted SnoaL-like aldol condensation-catalyzing enzyme
MVLGEGNFVLVVAEATFGGVPTAIYDLFRFESGKIAEHWDTLQAIPPRGQWKNSNGKF